MSVEAGASTELCLLRSLALAKSPFLAGHGECSTEISSCREFLSREPQLPSTFAKRLKVLHIDMGGALRLETA